MKIMLPEVRKMFQALDSDGSGTVTLEEILAGPKEIRQNLAAVGQIEAEDIMELFAVLDQSQDGCGEVNVEEFCDGIYNLAVTNQPLHMIKQQKQIAMAKMAS